MLKIYDLVEESRPNPKLNIWRRAMGRLSVARATVFNLSRNQGPF